jgi:putative transposase
MPRKPRRVQWTETACFHVLNRGHNRERIFIDDDDRLFFLRLLARYQKRYAQKLFHYCLMDNHFHLLVQMQDVKQLSGWMAGLTRSYVHYYHRRYRFVGHLFQSRFKSPAIQMESYLLSCGRYIERNPLRAGMVALPWEYRWSSCRAYALGEADELLSDNPYYLELSPDPARRQALWQQFLIDADPKEALVAEAHWVLGDEEFRRQAAILHGRPIGRGRGRPRGDPASPVPQGK